MITLSEIKSIDYAYFEVLHCSSYAIYLKSRYSGHYWGIILEEYRNFRHFRVYHKHHSYNVYHRHSDAKSINLAIQRIKQHDVFHLTERNARKTRIC